MSRKDSESDKGRQGLARSESKDDAKGKKEETTDNAKTIEEEELEVGNVSVFLALFMIGLLFSVGCFYRTFTLELVVLDTFQGLGVKRFYLLIFVQQHLELF